MEADGFPQYSTQNMYICHQIWCYMLIIAYGTSFFWSRFRKIPNTFAIRNLSCIFHLALVCQCSSIYRYLAHLNRCYTSKHTVSLEFATKPAKETKIVAPHLMACSRPAVSSWLPLRMVTWPLILNLVRILSGFLAYIVNCWPSATAAEQNSTPVNPASLLETVAGTEGRAKVWVLPVAPTTRMRDTIVSASAYHSPTLSLIHRDKAQVVA